MELSDAFTSANALPSKLLAINGGSSSIKFAIYQTGEPLTRLLHGMIDRIGRRVGVLTFKVAGANRQESVAISASDHTAAASSLIDWLRRRVEFEGVIAVGHRVVHGMMLSEPTFVTTELLDELHSISDIDPAHLPREIELIEEFRKRFPHMAHIACFDTAFHSTMPRVATMLPVPRRYFAKGVRRYGFHGLSYAYMMHELTRVAGDDATRGRVILAHLGNGASVAAVRAGESVDTSMGFTPASGLPMSSRSGDLDPGLAMYLAQSEGMTATQFHEMVNRESGLLGVSETSSDMRELLALETTDARASEAVTLFCYSAKKWIGAFAAVLGGLDTLVFSGGVGENAPSVRARICDDLHFLGIVLDKERNDKNASLISSSASRVSVRVIRTDEEFMIANSVNRIVETAARQ